MRSLDEILKHRHLAKARATMRENNVQSRSSSDKSLKNEDVVKANKPKSKHV